MEVNEAILWSRENWYKVSKQNIGSTFKDSNILKYIKENESAMQGHGPARINGKNRRYSGLSLKLGN